MSGAEEARAAALKPDGRADGDASAAPGFRKAYLTLATTLVVMIAAVLVEGVVEAVQRGSLRDYDPSHTLFIALLVGGPIAYFWIAQRIDATALRDEVMRAMVGQVAATEAAQTALRQLRETEARLSILADNASDIFISITPEGRITYVSPNARRYGYSQEGLQGSSVFDLAHPDDRAGIVGVLAQFFDGNGEALLADPSLRFRTQDGDWRWMEASPILVRDGAGRAVAITAVLRDITERKAAVDAIVASEARFRMIADNVTDIIIQFGPDQGIRYASPACRQMGYAPGELVGRSVATLIHPDDLPAMREVQARRVKGLPGAGPTLIQCRVLKADGRVSWVEGSTATILNDSGQPDGAVTVLRIIDDRKSAADAVAASEAQFRLLAENASDVISRCGPDGVLTYISPSAKRVLGYDPEELVGTQAFRLINPDQGAWVTAHFAAAIQSGATGPLEPFEYQAITKSGEAIWIEASPSIVRNPVTGRLLELQDTMRDVSARKAMEAELRRKHAEAEAAAVAKADFLANISHELRTPLTGIIGFSSLLEGVEGLPPTARTFIQRITSSSRALLGLVSDILDFSKMDAGQVILDPQRVDPQALLREAIDVVGAQAEAKSLVVRLEVEGRLPGHVRLDGQRLRQIVLNLLSNAVKFTNQGEIVVQARHSADRGGLLTVTVRDTGVGIAENRAEHLFERFTQADSSISRRHGGTGLGLSICKALAELMGGTIGAHSVAGQGSAFTFEVLAPPASVAAATSLPPATAPLAVRSGVPRVLIVDDVALNVELIKTMLFQVELETFEAEDGVGAVDLCRATAFDLILMDLRMPNMDGLEATRVIRAECPLNRETPIVAVSANSAPSDVDACLAAGMNDHIAKPIGSSELMAKVRHWTHRSASAA